MNDLDKLKQALYEYKQTSEVLFGLLDDYLAKNDENRDGTDADEKPDHE